jgi:hypothetical protein
LQANGRQAVLSETGGGHTQSCYTAWVSSPFIICSDSIVILTIPQLKPLASPSQGCVPYDARIHHLLCCKLLGYALTVFNNKAHSILCTRSPSHQTQTAPIRSSGPRPSSLTSESPRV